MPSTDERGPQVVGDGLQVHPSSRPAHGGARWRCSRWRAPDSRSVIACSRAKLSQKVPLGLLTLADVPGNDQFPGRPPLPVGKGQVVSSPALPAMITSS